MTLPRRARYLISPNDGALPKLPGVLSLLAICALLGVTVGAASVLVGVGCSGTDGGALGAPPAELPFGLVRILPRRRIVPLLAAGSLVLLAACISFSGAGTVVSFRSSEDDAGKPGPDSLLHAHTTSIAVAMVAFQRMFTSRLKSPQT
jgi:hypothetical protein